MPRNRTSMGNDVIRGGRSNDALAGGYGNDVLRGGAGDDQLDGGRGNDRLQGGQGNDVIVSRSDAGEGAIAQDISNTGIDATTRRVYPNQAGLPADDVLTGGAGADQFRFQALINAKAEILRKHADANGVIDYAGVAGENNLVHDHWVDGIGNDVITDFNKAEGDTIAISGHTTEVYDIEITDADNDGQVDDTVLHLRSNQGNAGAHHLDQLGTITVLNNKLTAGDFTVDANVTDGIVENISQLREAIAPYNPAAPGAAAMAGAGGQGGNAVSGTVSNRTSLGNDVISGGRGRDTLSGDYGDDVLRGGGGRDRLDGGRGGDTVLGGAGRDVIISRSDGGETAIAQAINGNNDPNTEVDAVTRRIYANQAGLAADDVLTGGRGADEFRFETLINAKEDIIRKYADANGVIDWAGVAGENNLVHDHWVDGIGNDVITDFNKAQGDKITITGHTTEVYKIDITDADGDGAADDTVLHLRSNQGNAGAHHLDLLGTITVLNNQLTRNDFTVDANSTAGIIQNISQLAEAIAPGSSVAMAAGAAGYGASASAGGSTASGQGTAHACGTSAAEDQTATAGPTAGTAESGATGHGAAHGSTASASTGQMAYGGSASAAAHTMDHGSASTAAAEGASTGGAQGTASGSSLAAPPAATGTAASSQAAAHECGTDAGNEQASGGGSVNSGSGTVSGSADAGSGAATSAGTGTGQATGTGWGHGSDHAGTTSAPAAEPASGTSPIINPAPTGPLASLANNWGDNIIDGNEGDDHIHGGHGDDVVSCHAGNDRLTGDYGDDILLGGAGDDRMSGDRGDDALFGGAGNDVLEGGSGHDLLMGGAGSDTINGGTGIDALLLAGRFDEYMIEVVGDQVRLADLVEDRDGGIDIVTQVEYYRFLANGETYVVQNGAFMRTTDTEAVDELLSGHLLQDLIEAESASVAVAGATPTGGSASGTAAGAASVATASVAADATTASTAGAQSHDDGVVHTHADLLAA